MLPTRRQIPRWGFPVVLGATGIALAMTMALRTPAAWEDVITLTTIVFSCIICFYRAWWPEPRFWWRVAIAFAVHSAFAVGAIATGIIGLRGLGSGAFTFITVGELLIIVAFYGKYPLAPPRSE